MSVLQDALPEFSSARPLPIPTIRKRDGSFAEFDGERIRLAIEKAFRAELALAPEIVLPEATAQKILELATQVIEWCAACETLQVERVQDEVERVLMERGEHRVARRYVLYREQHAERRRKQVIHVRAADGSLSEFDPHSLQRRIEEACAGLGPDVQAQPILDQTLASLYNNITEAEIAQAAIFAARTQVEREPDYRFVAARLLLGKLYEEAVGYETPLAQSAPMYRAYFARGLRAAVEAELITPELLTFDLERLAAAIRPERDLLFAFMGLQTLYDRYFLQSAGRRIELPQLFWMRVAMGLALNEADREARAIEFYDLISQFRFTPATPTLFNAGTLHPQLSSCYLTTVPDDLFAIFKCVQDNAMLSKWAGGLGNDWTPVRALGAHIKGTNGQSQGIIPFLKVANDAAVAVNQGGKRKGAVCAYLETWHLDIEEFLELRKNTGDDRRRTHDMNTANWIPDLFMRRVIENGVWTLFSPNDVPDLHDLYGKDFAVRYEEYERMAEAGTLPLFKQLPALDLWRKMLSMLFETGHAWITWKDPSNVRSPQDHAGVVHNSNLCTEILLNNSADETAVCNLGSINLVAHITDGALNLPLLETTVGVAVRMLDNVIDLNYYPTQEAQNANFRHRPVGLGLMGFQDALYELGIGYASAEAVDFADQSMEAISYFALFASTRLAQERGAYGSYAGSKWDRGLLPIDTLELLEQERGVPLQVERSNRLDWTPVREAIRQHGLRNSNLLAIAPTATISNIVGVTQSIEPTYSNLFVKSNLSGEFTQLNERLVQDLKRLELWDAQMLDEIKYYDGVLAEVERIPENLKQRYQTAFEIGALWLIECAARRQKWLDMGQSLNLYMAAPNGKKLHDMYFLAWAKGLKTTYYLRTLAATQVEKSTLDINRFGIQPRWMKNKSASSAVELERPGTTAPACGLDGECEACQ
ncbi:MAG: nrdZ [Chthonomonadales bacterium]|nr:nrdZ [Chthonomonadales bacterium]